MTEREIRERYIMIEECEEGVHEELENRVKYNRELNGWGFQFYDGNAWCAAFQVWAMKKLLLSLNSEMPITKIMPIDGWTPTMAGHYQTRKRWSSEAKEGRHIFFKDSKRIHHVGLVIGVSRRYIETIEGNAGDAVRRRRYNKMDASIAGYGEPDYTALAEDYKAVGWHSDSKGWWYRYSYGSGKKTYYHNCFRMINGHTYYFNSEGYIMTLPLTLDVVGLAVGPDSKTGWLV